MRQFTRVKKITAKKAREINTRTGMETWEEDGGKTYWAADEAETGTYFFDTLKERNEFVARHNEKADAYDKRVEYVREVHIEKAVARAEEMENKYPDIVNVSDRDFEIVSEVLVDMGITEITVGDRIGNLIDFIGALKRTGWKVVDIIEINERRETDYYEGNPYGYKKYITRPALLFRYE